MNFMLVVNDLDFGKAWVSAEDIANTLLDAGVWLYSPTTPNVRTISAGDTVLLYMAGKGRRYFCASFEIAGEVTAAMPDLTGHVGELLTNVFSLSSPITGIERWATRVHAKPIRHDLEFITDKKNWGLHFRQSTKVMSDHDYNRIQQERRALSS